MKYKDRQWVILFGGANREEVVNSLHSNHIKISKIFVPQNQSPRLRNSILSLKHLGILIQEVSKSDLESALLNHENDVLLSIGFPYLIKRNILSRHPIALNIHPTLLPKYRGATSGAYILINNEKISGSTIHLVDDNIDSGAIVAQSKVCLSPFDTIRSMQRKVYASEPELVHTAIRLLDSGILPKAQDETLSTTFNTIRKPADSCIDPSKPLIDLLNEIRACDPLDFPAFFIFKGEKVCIKLWRPDKPQSEYDMI